MTRRISSIATIAALFLGIAFAQHETPLTRDEVASIKKKIVSVLDALGQPPAGYSSEKESFHLTTACSGRRLAPPLMPNVRHALIWSRQRTFPSAEFIS